MISRRDLLATLLRLAPIIGGAGMILSDPFWRRFLTGGSAGLAFGGTYADELLQTAPRARYWTSPASSDANCRACHNNPDPIKGRSYLHKDKIVKCLLCAQGCVIGSGQRGKCRARMNVGGELKSLAYGRPVAIHIDPIEKRPLYHYLPGAAAYSLATAGCPLRCKFCQNWAISQAAPEDHQVSFTPPGKIVAAARENKAPVIAFTYNEPTVFTEYLTDIARDAKKQGIRSVLISCGFMNESPLTEMCKALDAIKIDLKGYSEDFYRNACGAELRPVLRSIKQIAKSRAHLEIVNLVVPTLNDSDKMLQGLIDWILGEVGPDVPIHFTRFHPDYQLLNLPPTPVATLERARDLALSKGMHYPYVGNVPGPSGQSYLLSKLQKGCRRATGIFCYPGEHHGRALQILPAEDRRRLGIIRRLPKMKPLRLSMTILVISLSFAVACPANRVSDADVREPEFAGKFYPDSAGKLKLAIEKFLQDASPVKVEKPVAIVVPHAGYIYSGQICADGFKQAAIQKYDVVVILGTNHTTPNYRKIALYPGSGFRTPLGVALIHKNVVSALLKADHI